MKDEDAAFATYLKQYGEVKFKWSELKEAMLSLSRPVETEQKFRRESKEEDDASGRQRWMKIAAGGSS
jgi:hypothetical protein